MTVVVSIASMSCRASAGSSTGVLPRRTIWRGPRTAGLVGIDWMADDHPIEQVTQRGQAELRGRRRSRALQLLDVGSDMHALNRGELRDALRF
jgi:hypothetical protein